ncbi:MAG: LysM peptidoglycan-binding domain-containing protein [Bacteroidales bacterium]|nr:LysM peptidoglycan-binding domain-containing protein [Bacteroidales bacterium]
MLFRLLEMWLRRCPERYYYSLFLWFFVFFSSYQLINAQVKKFPPLYYEYRIEELSKTTPIRLDYNADVQKYIDLYLDTRAEKLSRYLTLKDRYFPIFEAALDRYDLPLELKYLPIVESGLDPLARSSSGAMGLWQLLYPSAKLLGLNITSYKDERCDVYLSTDAACRYLKYLYSLFNDWQLVLAAYNGGPGEVRNAIARSGGKTNFWELQPFLPEQTRWYVPAFIAVFYLMNNAAAHGIYPASFSFPSIDTLKITQAAQFSKIAAKIDISIEQLRELNPAYRKDFIPSSDSPQILVLPSDKILTFLKYEYQIYALSDTSGNFRNAKTFTDTVGKKMTEYIVKPGDFLHKIALEQGCSPESIKQWNGLSNDQLKVGQRLKLWVSPQMAMNNVKEKYFYYTVKKGDTLYSIAEKFRCDSINDIKLVNNITDERSLKVGQILKIRIVTVD